MINPVDSIWLVAILAGVAMLLDWSAVFFNWSAVKPFSKPLVMFLIILWTGLAFPGERHIWFVVFLTAQVCGLFGDIFLLFSGKAFLYGLSAFLLGHLLYLSVMIYSLFFTAAHSFLDDSLPLLMGCAAWIVFLSAFVWLFRPVFSENARHKRMWLPVIVYAVFLSAMACLSLIAALASDFALWATILALGGLLFLVSDTLLAYDRFARKLRYGRLFVRITYHLAQACLAWGGIFLITIK